MLNMLGVDVCAYGFGGLGMGICALMTQILYGALELVCKLIGTFVDLLNIAFFIFAGVDFGDGMFNVIAGGESTNLLDYFIFNETVTKSYLYLALIALVLVAIFTIYKIIKQDYFDKAGPRSKGPIFRNVAISCISFILVIPIFYLIIHASSLLAVQVSEAMGMDPYTFAGMRVFELSWSDHGYAMHIINNQLHEASASGAVIENAGSVWYLEGNLLFVLLADGELVKYDQEVLSALRLSTYGLLSWEGPLAYYGRSTPVDGIGTVRNQLFYANFYWYIYFVGIIVALKAMWNLVLAMIQRIFKLLGLFLVAPAPISQYVLDDGAKFKEWLKKSIEEGLRLVVACMSFAIFLMVLGLVTDIDFATAFETSMKKVSGGRAESVNVSASTLSYSGEFANVPQLNDVGLFDVTGDGEATLPTKWEGVVDSWEYFFGAHSGDIGAWEGCAAGNRVIVKGGYKCEPSFFARLINAFLQILLVIAAGGAIKDLDSVLSPLISGAQSSLDSGNTGGAVNAVGKAAMAVAGAAIGGVASGAINAVKNKDAASAGAQAGAAEEEKDADSAKSDDAAQPSSPTSGVSSPTDGGGDDSDEAGGVDGDGATETPTTDEPGDNGGGDDDNNDQSDEAGNVDPNETETPTEGGDNDTEGGDKDADKQATATDAGAAAEVDKDKVTGKDVGKALVGDIASIKKVGAGIKSGINKLKEGAAKIGDKALNTKAGKFFTKNLIGRIIAAPGKLAMRAAKNVVKNGPRAILGGLKRGALAGLKTAGGAIATAVVGEGTVKSFMNAKKESDEAEKNAANKKFDKARNQAFTEKRNERIQKAQENASNASTTYDGAVETAQDKAKAENAAAQNLDKAEQGVMAAEAAASSANSDILAQDKELLAAQAEARENDALVAEAERDNKNILKTAGVDNFDELESKIALLPKGSEERTKLEGLRKKYIPEKTMKEWQAKADTARDAATERARMLDTLSGRDGRLSKAGVAADSTFEQAKATVDTKMASAQTTIDTLGKKKPSELSAAEKKQLAEATEIKQLHDDLSKCDKAQQTYFERKTVQNARTQNENLAKAKIAKADAQSAYNKAHSETVAAQSEVEKAASTFEKSNGLAYRLMGTEGYSANMGQTSFGGKSGGRNDAANSRRARNERMLKAGMADTKRSKGLKKKDGQTVYGADASLETKVVGNVSTPTEARKLYDSCAEYTQEVYDTARDTFMDKTEKSPSGKSMEEILTAQNVNKGKDGHYSVRKIRKLVNENAFGEDTEYVTKRLGAYEAATKTYDAQQKTISRVETSKQTAGAIAQRIVTNATRSSTLANESALMQQVIASGGDIKLTPQMTQILNSVPGAHITAQSSKADVLEAAKTARHQRILDQEEIRRENAGLSSQNNQIQESMKSMISGLANELRGKDSGAKNPTQVTNNQQQTITNINNNNMSNNGTSTSMFDFSAAIKTPDQMTEAMYEKTQTELAKANKEMLDRIKEQNRDILQTVEDIEREVKED